MLNTAKLVKESCCGLLTSLLTSVNRTDQEKFRKMVPIAIILCQHKFIVHGVVELLM